MVILEYKGRIPNIIDNCYIYPLATIIGDVTVNDNAIIWPGSIIRAENSKINIGRYCIIESGVTILGCFMEDYIQIMEGSLIYEESSIGEGSIIIKNSQIPPGLTIPARSVLRGIPVEPIREQSRNEVLKQKDRAEHYSQLFMKIKEQLPNAQSYLLTLPDFIKLLLQKEN